MRLIRMLVFFVISGAVVAWSAEPPADSAANSEPVALEVFTAPEIARATQPNYPISERRSGRDGTVLVNLMVDKQGEPYEISVVDSTGNNKALEQSTLEEVKKWRFKPAMLDGVPVESGTNVKVTFILTGNPNGARPSFYDDYKQLIKAVNDGDRARADLELAELGAKTLYEDAFRYLATYQYYTKWGTDAQQLEALKRVVANENKPVYLSMEQYRQVLENLLILKVKTQDFGGALLTWKKVQSVAPKDVVDRWRSSMDRISAMRASGPAYRVSGELIQSSWFYHLFKQRFQIQAESGALTEIKLRCDKKYVFFRFDPQLEYKIDDKYGECQMELVGDPGTKFFLTQL